MNIERVRQVCVTGATGYIGSHVARTLLEKGYSVIAPVRNPQRTESLRHLFAMPGSERLKCVKADVLEPGVWDGIVADADGVIHCAAVVSFAAKDPQREIVDVAVEGTRHVLGAAARSSRTHTVVHLSSIAALITYAHSRDYKFSAKDWCEDANLATNPYGLAKTLSEKLAWELQAKSQSEPALSPFELNVICPGYVLGPLLSPAHVRSSPGIVRDILSRAYPGCPKLNFSIVDVRDIARAAVTLLEGGKRAQRVVMVNRGRDWRELAASLAAKFPYQGIRTRTLPNWLLFANALLDPRVSLGFLKHNLGRELLLEDGGEASFGMKYTAIEDTLFATAESLYELGVVARRTAR
ncbi:MAG: SDR family NAD(P)-dependent oxidoreductase [Polyangiaceae bacterium]|nr:SDR family NAD(P)-dependent oxidoreductase [Polyangiaceae bacterium]